MVTFENVQPLYEKYLDLVRFEVETLDVKPTEMRHLIGRLGEFHCVKEVQGSLPARANQPGFDVLSLGGRRISVKTTAQISGFVTISKRTLQGADDLMLVQYAEGRTKTIFHGCIQHPWRAPLWRELRVGYFKGEKTGDGRAIPSVIGSAATAVLYVMGVDKNGSNARP